MQHDRGVVAAQFRCASEPLVSKLIVQTRENAINTLLGLKDSFFLA